MRLSTVVVCGLLGLSVVEGLAVSSYDRGDPNYGGQSAQPRYSPASNRRPATVVNVESELDEILDIIERLEDRQLVRRRRIGYLRQTSNENLAFAFKYEIVASKDINKEISEQNTRLYGLAAKIAQIQGLRSQVVKLQYSVQEIRNSTENTADYDRETQDRLEATEEDDNQGDIEEARERANTTRDGLQEVADREFESARLLTAAELSVDHIRNELEYHTATSAAVTLTLDRQGIANTTVGYPGFPEEHYGYLSGFQHILGSKSYGKPAQREVINIRATVYSPGPGTIEILAWGNSPYTQQTVQVLAFSYLNDDV